MEKGARVSEVLKVNYMPSQKALSYLGLLYKIVTIIQQYYIECMIQQ